MATQHVVPMLGKLTRVPIREVWSSEPYSFDPWLCELENLQFLADSVGLPGLELLSKQAPVGPFFADIICKVIGTEDIVLIENQLDPADHRHLGQVLTYAPHFDAKICIWVSERIRDEHRAAVDWLNRISSDGYAFFGVEVQAVKIGDSLPAPLFEAVAKPNDWSKITPASSVSTEAVAIQEDSNRKFWPLLHSRLLEIGVPARQASTELKGFQYWAPILSGGRAYIWAFRSFSKKPYVKAGLSLYNEGGKSIWDSLIAEKSVFETSFGEPLGWVPNPQGTAFHINGGEFFSSPDECNWPEQINWLSDQMLRLKETFLEAIRLADSNNCTTASAVDGDTGV